MDGLSRRPPIRLPRALAGAPERRRGPCGLKMPSAHLAVGLIVTASLLLMLIRPRDIAEGWWIGGGAAVLLVTTLMPWRTAVHAIGEGTDVYLFLAGMMLLSELARREGVFGWLASLAVGSSRHSRSRLFTMTYAIGTLVTIFMSNDATAVVLTPAILAAVKKAKVPPLPYLFVCAFVANAASFVLPISNPANLVVFDGAMPSLGRWLASFAIPSALSILTTYGALRWLFRHDLGGLVPDDGRPEPLSLAGRLVLVGLGLVTVVLLIASAVRADLGLPTCVASVVVTAAVCATAKRNPWPLARAISVGPLFLVAGLFILVDAIQGIGALDVTRAWLARATSLPPVAGALLAGSVVAVANNVVNNLPLGLIAGATLRQAHPSALLSNAVLIGVDLGPNLSVTGSLATILWLIALRKEKVNVSFFQFLKVGVVAMPLALLAALGGSVLMRGLVR
jgi:arsenical pump membrane protein